jgi:transketolase
MALAPAAYVLWTLFLRHNPRNPEWFDRDRFILSCGHASMLIYAMLHLTGYDLSLDEIKNFRQWGSKTAGHPEYRVAPGVETTTGPLGQGLMNAVGMAMAEAHLAARFNRTNFDIVDHYTYVFCSDGDLMEGASHEATSIAGHLGLGKLVVLYDDNRISIEGATELAYSDDVAKRFEGYHWHVQDIGDSANDLHALTTALTLARREKERPSLIIVRSHIAYGAPKMQDTPEAHGAPLGEEEIKQTKRIYGWPENEKFLVPNKVRSHMGRAVDQGEYLEREWNEKLAAYREAHPDVARRFDDALEGRLPEGWDRAIPEFKPTEKPVATRTASGKVLNAIARNVPWLVGGSADLAPSTRTLIEGEGYFAKGQYANRNIAWGVREHVMCAASSGMVLHGGVRPYASTFLIFTDYARPAIRLAALMEIPVIYVMTHDSIGLGEDGPTHQPIEHLPALRAIPHLRVIRPADANETAYAWRVAILRRNGPTLLALTRQNVPIFDRSRYAGAEGVQRGAYVLSREKGQRADVLLIGSGSEVQLVLEAQQKLAAEKIDARVVSMPCWEIFREQSPEYRGEIFPAEVAARLAVEAASPMGWREWVGDKGDVLGIDRFGASAPDNEMFRHYGFTVENVVKRARRLLDRE